MNPPASVAQHLARPWMLIAAGALALAALACGMPRYQLSIPPTSIAVYSEPGVYVVRVPEPRWPNWLFRLQQDDIEHGSASKLAMSENGRALGPPHTSVSDIGAYRAGRFAHWDGSLYFTASDNSDPRRNGRSYTAEAPLHPTWLVWLIISTLLVGGAGWHLAAEKRRRATAGVGAKLERWASSLSPYLIVVLAFGLTMAAHEHISAAPIRDDAKENITIAFNIVHHGTFSDGSEANGYAPTSLREPFPIYLIAAHIALHPELSQSSLEGLTEGLGVEALKEHNLIWLLLCYLGIAATTRIAFSNQLIAALVAASVMLLTNRDIAAATDLMYTEFQAMALIIWSSAALLKAVRSQQSIWFAAVGLLLGCLTLTKATTLYVVIGLAFFAVAFVLWKARSKDVKRHAISAAVTAAAFGLVVVPWMARNALVLGSFHIAERGGVVLLARAVKNGMTEEELRGAMFAYSPDAFRTIVGRVTGHEVRDLAAGGRLQRLNRFANIDSDTKAEHAGAPEDAVSYYHQTRAYHVRAMREASDLSGQRQRIAADAEVTSMALSKIMQDPLRHTIMSVVFLWRGSGLLSLPLFLMFVVGVLKRDAVYLSLSSVAATSVAFLALATHFMPRYFDPMLPMAYLSLGVMAAALVAFCVSGAKSTATRVFRRDLPPSLPS